MDKSPSGWCAVSQCSGGRGGQQPVVVEKVVVVGEGMPMVVSREKWVQLMFVASAMWVEVVW